MGRGGKESFGAFVFRSFGKLNGHCSQHEKLFFDTLPRLRVKKWRKVSFRINRQYGQHSVESIPSHVYKILENMPIFARTRALVRLYNLIIVTEARPNRWPSRFVWTYLIACHTTRRTSKTATSWVSRKCWSGCITWCKPILARRRWEQST